MFGITFKMAKGLSSLSRVCYTFNWHIWHLKLVNGLKCLYILDWKVHVELVGSYGPSITYGLMVVLLIDLWISG